MTIDQINDILDNLIDEAKRECEIAQTKAVAYREGYINGCEEFGKRLRRTIYKERIENK